MRKGLTWLGSSMKGRVVKGREMIEREGRGRESKGKVWAEGRKGRVVKGRAGKGIKAGKGQGKLGIKRAVLGNGWQGLRREGY